MFHAGADAMPVLVGVEYVLAAMPSLIAHPTRGNDVVISIATTILASLQMFCRTAQQVCLGELSG